MCLTLFKHEKQFHPLIFSYGLSIPYARADFALKIQKVSKKCNLDFLRPLQS